VKLKTTKKQIKENTNNIFAVGYCAMQSLLRYQDAFAYSSGKNGWACDYYNIEGVIISTGYSPIGNDPAYGIIRKYEEKAKKINQEFDYKTARAKVNVLLIELVNILMDDLFKKLWGKTN
tara:strand:+ start:793 stop:1152 length:360 start_codon:yes stop_codon:yes gene_type:complete